jgi:hypothetical protein
MLEIIGGRLSAVSLVKKQGILGSRERQRRSRVVRTIQAVYDIPLTKMRKEFLPLCSPESI